MTKVLYSERLTASGCILLAPPSTSGKVIKKLLTFGNYE